MTNGPAQLECLAAPDGAHALAAQVRGLIGGRLDILVSNTTAHAATIEVLKPFSGRFFHFITDRRALAVSSGR